MKKLTRDETEHGQHYYLASEVEAALAQPAQPVQGEWVGLTDEEINEWTPEIHGVIQAIEAKLKQKNYINDY